MVYYSVIHQHAFIVFRFEEQFVLGLFLGEAGEDFFQVPFEARRGLFGRGQRIGHTNIDPVNEQRMPP